MSRRAIVVAAFLLVGDGSGRGAASGRRIAPPAAIRAASGLRCRPGSTAPGRHDDASVAFDAAGHVWARRAGEPPSAIHANGEFIRAFGEGFTRTHGLRFDATATSGSPTSAPIRREDDAAGPRAVDARGQGRSGRLERSRRVRKLNQPNDVVRPRRRSLRRAGAHAGSEGDPRVLKFDRDGEFVKSWGGKGGSPEVPGPARYRDRCEGSALGDRSREPADSDLRRGRHLRP